MSGAVDSGARDVALVQITDKGGTCTHTPAGGVAVSGPCIEIMEGYALFKDGAVQETDRYFMLPAKAFVVEPTGGDLFDHGGLTYVVAQVKRLQPGVLPILWYLRVAI